MINGTAVQKLLDAMEKLQDAYRDMLNAAELATPKVKIAHEYKLWIDDVRPAPAGWITFTTVNGALDFIHQAILDGDVVSMISLDHDAGAYRSCGGDYINLLNAIEYEINVKKDAEKLLFNICIFRHEFLRIVQNARCIFMKNFVV